MKPNYPAKADPRPKRRRENDNPYELITSGIQTDSPRYYVRFTDVNGTTHCLEVSHEVFDAMDKLELKELAFMNESDRHYERSELCEATMTRRAFEPPESTYEKVEALIQKEAVHRAVDLLPEIQRRRLLLYYFENMTLEQIADKEGCTKQAVKDTLRTAEKFLSKILKNFQ